MIHHNARIQNGNFHTLAGITSLIQHVSADHGGGVAGHRLVGVASVQRIILRQLEGGGHIHVVHTGHSLQSFLVAILGGHRNAGGGNGVSKADLKILVRGKALCHLGLQRIQRSRLLGLITSHASRPRGDIVCGEAGSQQGLLLHHNDEVHHIRILGSLRLAGLGQGKASGSVMDDLRLIFQGIAAGFHGGGVQHAGLRLNPGVHRQLQRAALIAGRFRIRAYKAAACGGSHGDASQNHGQHQQPR